MKLIVSLPDNELSLAHAAAAGGTDAVKVHMNAVHRASGASFGAFAREKERVLKLIGDAGTQVGLMPGQQVLPSLAELNELIDAGLGFIDIYAHHLPASYLHLGLRTDLIPAIDRMHPPNEVSALTGTTIQGKQVISMLEAAVVPPDSYGKPLISADVADYRSLVQTSEKPVLVPTQKAIVPEDLPALADAGVGGIMIGVVVTGPTAAGIEKVTRRFRAAIDKLEG
ncbi:hypothetical protein J7J84_02010 [bacterium]|nr:hypothetical protein [bacterium]